MSKDNSHEQKVISLTCKECGQDWFSDDKDSWLNDVPWCCRQHMITDEVFSKIVWTRGAMIGKQVTMCRTCQTPVYEHMGVQTSGGPASPYYFGNLSECCKSFCAHMWY